MSRGWEQNERDGFRLRGRAKIVAVASTDYTDAQLIPAPTHQNPCVAPNVIAGEGRPSTSFQTATAKTWMAGPSQAGPGHDHMGRAHRDQV